MPMTKRLARLLKELPSRFLGGAVFRDPELFDEQKVPLRLTRERIRRPFEAAVTAAKLVQIVKNEDGDREAVSFHFHDLGHS